MGGDRPASPPAAGGDGAQVQRGSKDRGDCADPGKEFRGGQAAAAPRRRTAPPRAAAGIRDWCDVMNDPELEELFGDPADRALVDLLKASRPAAPPLDPHFHNYLRAKLMTEARRTLPARASRSWLPFRLSPKTMAPAMAAVAAGFLVGRGVEIYLHGPTGAPGIAQADIGAIKNKKDVGTGGPVGISFTRPVDKTAGGEKVGMH